MSAENQSRVNYSLTVLPSLDRHCRSCFHADKKRLIAILVGFASDDMLNQIVNMHIAAAIGCRPLKLINRNLAS